MIPYKYKQVYELIVMNHGFAIFENSSTHVEVLLMTYKHFITSKW